MNNIFNQNMQNRMRLIINITFHLIIILGCGGCATSILVDETTVFVPTYEFTSLPSLTSTPDYLEFQSRYIHFRYPSNWSVNSRTETGIELLLFYELVNGVEIKQNYIAINFYPDTARDDNEDAEGYIIATDQMGGKILSDQIIEIDGHPARYLTRSIPEKLDVDWRKPASYDEDIFLSWDNNTLMVFLSVKQAEAQGNFVEEFHKMITTIKIVSE